MLSLLIGRSGSGKSTYLREVSEKYIIQGKPVLVLVPEQFSFETGLYFLDKNSKATNENVKVLSFSTMQKYVFSQVGGVTNDFLDEGTSKVLMSLAIESCSNQLKLYEKQIKNKNFVDVMLSAINEYKSSCISSEQLLATKAKISNPTLKQKLEETALVLDAYNGYVNQSHIHPQDILIYLAEKIAENHIFKGYTVFIDAFTGFTMAQYRVLEPIFRQADDIYLTLASDCKNQKIDTNSIRFRVTTDTYHKIRALAEKSNKTVKEIYLPFENNLRAKGEDLVAVEKNLYAFPQQSYNGEVENVFMYSATDIYNECEYVASTIKRLTVQENYRYKDIAVVCRDEEQYRGILDATFDKFNIGYYMDNPVNINSKPLVNFIRHAFDAVNNGFNSESILRMLKTDITIYSYQDISLIENYLFSWGAKWSLPFTQNINGFGGDQMTESDISNLEKIETIRSNVFSSLLNFQKATASANGLEISQAISQLLKDFNVKKVITDKIRKLDKQNNPELTDEYTRVWHSVVGVVSMLANILGDTVVTGKYYHQLFTMAINCRQIANQPLCIDRVIIGTAGRARLNSPRITFIIGAVQGVFPAVPTEGGVFTDNERQLLLSTGLQINCGLLDLSAQEQQSAYSSLASPSERLYISYYTNTINGGGAIPSTIVTQVNKILPRLKTTYRCNTYDFDQNQLWCRQQAFERTVANINNTYDQNKGLLLEYFKDIENYRKIFDSIDEYKSNLQPSIKKDTAVALYGENMHLSPSRVEDFYNCGYLYFCKNGLKLKERRKQGIDSLEYGALVHYVMEKFLKQENIEDIIENTTKYNIPAMVAEITSKYIENTFEKGVLPNQKTKFALLRAEKNCIVLVNRLLSELKVSNFRPVDFELSIGLNLEDKKNIIDKYTVKTRDGELSIVGIVDRVDLFKNPIDGKTYVRIVDYKTGGKEMKRLELEMGLNLQMFIYLSAIMKNGKNLYGQNLAPAGVCYMPANEFTNTVSTQTPLSEEEVKGELKKHYTASGLFLRDPGIITAMDTTLSGEYIPVKLKIKPPKKKDSTQTPEISYPYSEKKLLDGDQYSGDFKAVFDLVDSKLKNMSDMLLDGYISAVPSAENGKIEGKPCTYCLYSSSCVFKQGMAVNEIPSDKSAKEVKKNG